MIFADKVAVATEVAGVSHVLILPTQRLPGLPLVLEPGIVLLLHGFAGS
jgi:hypothetical protein